MEYNHLYIKEMRDEIVRIGNELASYLHDNNINNIIFADRSARPGYVALTGAWKNLFPEEKLPNMYFTNPEGYENRGADEVAKEFDKTYVNLSSDKTQKIMLFDVCMHTGRTMKPMLNVLRNAGYENISVGLTHPKDDYYNCNIKVNLSTLPFIPEGSCYPFKRDYIIEKNRSSVISSPNRNKKDRGTSIRLRKEISSLF